MRALDAPVGIIVDGHPTHSTLRTELVEPAMEATVVADEIADLLAPLTAEPLPPAALMRIQRAHGLALAASVAARDFAGRIDRWRAEGLPV